MTSEQRSEIAKIAASAQADFHEETMAQ